MLPPDSLRNIVAYSDCMFGVAKPMCCVDYDSDEEFEDEEIFDQPIYLEEPKKAEKPVWVSSLSKNSKK